MVATDVQSGSSRRNVGTDVTVTVGDVEEDGKLAVDNLSPSAGQTVTFRLTDPDGGIDTANMTWVIQSLGDWGIMDEGLRRAHPRLGDLPLDR